MAQPCLASDGLPYGDVNGDGEVNGFDAQLILQEITNPGTLTPEQLVRADVNGDGKVTSMDVTLVLQFAARQIDSFPVCQRRGLGPLLILGLLLLALLVSRRR